MPTRRTFLATSAAGAITALSGRPGFSETDSSVEVAAILPFSGNLEIFGAQARVGLDLAQSEINQAGGILGRPLHVRYEDNRSDPIRGAGLVGDIDRQGKPLAIVGPISSAVRDAMMPEVANHKIPLLYATNYEGGVCDRYFFCFNTVPNQETGRMLPYLNANFGDRYFMLGSDYVWPRKMFETAQTTIAKLRGETVGVRFEPIGTSAFTDAIRQIRASEATVLLLAVPGADGIAFMRQAKTDGLFNQVVVNFLGFEVTYLDQIGPMTGQGLFVVTPLVASADIPGVQDFVTRIHHSAGEGVVPSEYALTHYNALHALKAGVEKAGEISREAAVDGMAGLTFPSPTGPVSIDPSNHHVTLNMFLGKALGADFTMLVSLGPIPPQPECAA